MRVELGSRTAGPVRPEFSREEFDWELVARPAEKDWADRVGAMLTSLVVSTAKPTGRRPSKTNWPIRSGASARSFYSDSRGTFIAVKNKQWYARPLVESRRGIILKLWRAVVRGRASEEAKGRMLKRIRTAQRAQARKAQSKAR